MSTLTKEWLQQTIAELEEERDATPGAVNEDASMALAAMKLALASIEAEAVAYVMADDLKDSSIISTPAYRDLGEAMERTVGDVVALYTTPPAPVSMKDHQIRELVNELRDIAVEYQGTQQLRERIARTVRAAILQGAEPVTTAYKLRDAVETIRSSGIAIDADKIFAERDAINAPDCWCRTCRPITHTDMRFVVCPDCGNKRCPHANDHRNACTGSNEPGQEGSAYPAAPQQEMK